jgi:D-methionine transport system ATP-binding protein
MIRLEQVSKRYPAGRGSAAVAALQEVSLEIAGGEIFGIVGESGAGKSTLIRLVNLLERPDGGRVVVGGQDLTGLTPAALRQARRGIGMVFQHFNLLSARSVYRNVALPLEIAGLPAAAIRARVDPLLELVGLADKRARYPAELSGGQKQRVGIARALAAEPKVLLCDEATSALDPETTQAILALIRDINRRFELTVVVVTHEMEVVKALCERVGVLDQGRLAEVAPVFDLFTRPQSPAARRLIGFGKRPAEAALSDRGTRLRLVAGGSATAEPILSRVARESGADINILQGRIERIAGRPYADLLVALEGPAEARRKARALIDGTELFVEEIADEPAALRAVG